MSPIERRSAPCSTAVRTAMRCTVLNASATWPISSLESTATGTLPRSRSSIERALCNCVTTLGRRCSATSSEASRSRCSERAIDPATGTETPIARASTIATASA
jgi:hypothetical protein